jgi:N-acetylglucosaminyldiphosphoundecaprenol N-acetyl-beta-D-mannosaminyltransferase
MSMYQTRFPVLNTQISAVTFSDALHIIEQWIRQRQKYYINVCTTHTVLECYDSPILRDIINGSGLATPDGMPLVWIGRLHKYSIERVYGPDLMLALCEVGQDIPYRHFFYGGASGVAELLSNNLRTRYPRLQVAGVYSPPFRALTPDEEREIAMIINASNADIVWVGLGTPKQDYWVARFRPFLEAPVLIAVGAAFDFHSGNVKQAPVWMRHSGLEWLFRLLQDPKRLWKRYILGNPRFIYLLLKQVVYRQSRTL